MKNYEEEFLQLLKGMHALLTEINDMVSQEKAQRLEKLLNKNEVMAYLNISDATYRRYVDKGTLKPMCLGGIDLYYIPDLHEALEISRRKGRF
ncbi:helix-turn-helix domain-containing protein [Sphingobacterium sp. SGG-5]|uniref:helix-turn-helix domain-containing protein n=1 Tax=Sphingobacterium sp. SGG-5 TaxID=2710881 RepID=UPI0013ECEC38|nr:helix-turn-helix domain-containing protein [Sphingobacterium sp. SGG-5]NGM60485.1 helix-turn-helix domain-containing protein [Sphingobacterium sp. SGG-5]